MTELEKTIKDKDAVLANGTGSIAGNIRRRRTVYSRSHLELLLKTFKTNPYPGISVREKLSSLIGVHESRVQVWFQNRRARKNFKSTREKDGPDDIANPLFTKIPRVVQGAKSKRKLYGVKYTEKYESYKKTCVLPLHAGGHLNMNRYVAGPQPFGHMRSNHCQPTSAAAQSCFLNSFDITQPQVHPHMNPQLFPINNLSHAPNSLETHASGCSSAGDMAIEPGQDAVQGFSLQDILEEFQPCWTEVANNVTGVSDNPLF